VIAFVQSQLGEIEERKEWTPETEDAAQEPAEAEEAKQKRGLFARFRNN
jgi:hypothetical protein